MAKSSTALRASPPVKQIKTVLTALRPHDLPLPVAASETVEKLHISDQNIKQNGEHCYQE